MRPKRAHRWFAHDASWDDLPSYRLDILGARPARPERAQSKNDLHLHRSGSSSSGNPTAGEAARVLRALDALHLPDAHPR